MERCRRRVQATECLVIETPQRRMFSKDWHVIPHSIPPSNVIRAIVTWRDVPSTLELLCMTFSSAVVSRLKRRGSLAAIVSSIRPNMKAQSEYEFENTKPGSSSSALVLHTWLRSNIDFDGFYLVLET
ncbi:hypothetical protein TESG_08553 [Trichophyton tonsurans CBS 112818]|uniref:Uncharacterized protein n=1 Tax=Trichophyton tonsurans (strain CBS 112818) TaxID=647933 RepID=F2S549_TRIT1|nr:hypothetical protein TESG_08553 [Trichophyton tonsurans CBS 112818]